MSSSQIVYTQENSKIGILATPVFSRWVIFFNTLNVKDLQNTLFSCIKTN